MKRAAIAGCLMLSLLAPPMAADDSAMEAYGACVEVLTSGAPLPTNAVELCTRARQTKLPGADYALALLLLRDDESAGLTEATELLELAVESGHPGAAFTLAGLHLRSTDPASRRRGQQLFNFAFCSGHPQAKEVAPGLGFSPRDLECHTPSPLDLSGSWFSELRWVTAEPGSETPAPEIRVVLSGSTAQVYLKSDGAWREVKPGSFVATQLDGTAVVRSLDTGWDLDGQWVESWTIHLQRLDPGRGHMSLLRSVNNVYLPASSEWKTFTYLASGESKRDPG